MADKVINIGNSDNKVTVNVTDKIVCPTFEGTATNVPWSGITNKPNLVNSFGTKIGDITIRGDQTEKGSVNLVMSDNELQASIVGLGSNAYTSTAYLPLTGDILTGTLTLKANQTEGNSGLNANNSDIIGINSIYTCDLADNTSEGIRFYRDATHWDSLTANEGKLYFMPNDTLSGTAFGSANEIYHSGNLSPMTTSHPANSITKINIDNWNAVHTWYTTATADDTTNTIDTWKEIEAFVSSFNKGDNLATYLQNNYLAKATAKNYVVTLDDVQTITGAKTFSGDFYVGGTSGSRCHIKMDTTNKCIKFIFD